jgi:hypothetical protein
MLQQTLPGVEQSLSTLHSCKPFCAFWQLICAPGVRLVTTHACPLAESQFWSAVQN